MNTRSIPLALALCLALAAVAPAFDTVKRISSSSITGRVTKMSAVEVTAEPQGGIAKQVPINDIETIFYDAEPTLLKTARTAVAAGRYEDALAALEKVDPTSVTRAEIRQDIEFYTALSKAHLALAGSGDIEEVRKEMGAFVTKNSGNYHYLEACEVVGDLYMAAKNYPMAESAYGFVAKAPWPDYKMRSGVAVGRAQLAGGKAAEALASFDAVLAIEAQGEAVDSYRLAATLGKAQCLAEGGKADDAMNLVQGVIDRANPEDANLQAEAYNALGNAYRKAGQPKEALLAFLHVDVVYFSSPQQHIEALQNLNELWLELQKPERAAQAVQVLRERYKVSPRNQ